MNDRFQANSGYSLNPKPNSSKRPEADVRGANSLGYSAALRRDFRALQERPYAAGQPNSESSAKAKLWFGERIAGQFR
jgi:hypothetical protein